MSDHNITQQVPVFCMGNIQIWFISSSLTILQHVVSVLGQAE